jgi:hypothetical protein
MPYDWRYASTYCSAAALLAAYGFVGAVAVVSVPAPAGVSP